MTVHVVGGGLAGLAAAVDLAGRGERVCLYEAGPHAGGRCRSYFDAELGCRIDNGNHLLLTGNQAARRYLDETGAGATVVERPPVFPFFDAESGERWALRPNRGRLPWWILSRSRRVPQTRAADYVAALALRRAGREATVSQLLDRGGPLFRRMWEPLTVAALNTSAAQGSARLFGQILEETLGRGAAACRPLLPCEGLSETFVDPALQLLSRLGTEIRFGARLRTLGFETGRLRILAFDAGPVALASEDCAILAVPSAIAARLVPGLTVPDQVSPIANAHFRCTAPAASPDFIGVLGGTAQWIFRKRDVLSVTVSAADALVDRPAAELREALWRDVAQAYRLPPSPTPPARIVKERRATFLASPEQLRRRPATTTAWTNLLLAGDYVETGLPATIEGAIRSGFAAARQAVLGRGATLASRARAWRG